VVFSGTVAELASAAATFAGTATVKANVTGVQLVVQIGDALVWGEINDQQTANWTNIGNVQTAGWQQVNDIQTSGWTDIPS
jgi:hypothetical protein